MNIDLLSKNQVCILIEDRLKIYRNHAFNLIERIEKRVQMLSEEMNLLKELVTQSTINTARLNDKT